MFCMVWIISGFLCMNLLHTETFCKGVCRRLSPVHTVGISSDLKDGTTWYLLLVRCRVALENICSGVLSESAKSSLFVLMPWEQVESFVVLFSSACVHTSVTLVTCLAVMHVEGTLWPDRGTSLFSFYFFNAFCFFLPRAPWNKVDVTSSKEDGWDGAQKTRNIF